MNSISLNDHRAIVYELESKIARLKGALEKIRHADEISSCGLVRFSRIDIIAIAEIALENS